MKITFKFLSIIILATLFSCSESKLTITTTDQAQIVGFPDGSTAYLNKNSRITYAESFKDRVVSQEGEVFYVVKKGTVPFIVTTATGEVRVLGTEFTVTSNKKGMEVEVEKGTVEFRVDGLVKKIKKGQKALFKDIDKSFKMSKADFKHKKWQRNLKRDLRKLEKEINKGAKEIEKEAKKIGAKLQSEFKKLNTKN